MAFKFETANERMHYAGDLIQFPGQQPQQPEQNTKQLQIEFYNACAQIFKSELNLFRDPRYASLSEEEKRRLFDKAYDLISKGSVEFTD